MYSKTSRIFYDVPLIAQSTKTTLSYSGMSAFFIAAALSAYFFNYSSVFYGGFSYYFLFLGFIELFP